MTDRNSSQYLSLAAVMFHMMGIGLTLGLTFPLTSLTLERWGSSDTVIGLAGSMSPLAILLLMPILPAMAVRLGAIKAQLLGCSIASVALLLMYFIPTVPMWIFGRFVIGAGLALPWLVGDIWINTVASENIRGKAIAGYVASLFIGFSLGPLLLDAVGIGGIGPHLSGVAALVLAVVPLILARRYAPQIEVGKGGGLLAVSKAVPVVAVGAMVTGFTEAVAFSLSPVYALAIGFTEQNALRLLAVFIVGGVILQLIFGAVADKLNRQSLLGGIGIALALTSLALGVVTGLTEFVFMFVAGGLVLATYGLSMALLGQHFQPEQLAVASAAFLILYQVGSVAGPLVAGAAMQVLGAKGFLISLAIPGLLLAVVSLSGLFREKVKPDVSERI